MPPTPLAGDLGGGAPALTDTRCKFGRQLVRTPMVRRTSGQKDAKFIVVRVGKAINYQKKRLCHSISYRPFVQFPCGKNCQYGRRAGTCSSAAPCPRLIDLCTLEHRHLANALITVRNGAQGIDIEYLDRPPPELDQVLVGELGQRRADAAAGKAHHTAKLLLAQLN